MIEAALWRDYAAGLEEPAAIGERRSGMASILVKLFEHSRWANLSLVDACATLTDAHLDASVHGRKHEWHDRLHPDHVMDASVGSIRTTLMHIAGAEQRYVMRLSGRRPTYGERDGWPGAGRLRQALDESGRALIALVDRPHPDEMLAGEFQGRSYELAIHILYLVAINHADEHRSQIVTSLTQQGITLPQNLVNASW